MRIKSGKDKQVGRHANRTGIALLEMSLKGDPAGAGQGQLAKPRVSQANVRSRAEKIPYAELGIRGIMPSK